MINVVVAASRCGDAFLLQRRTQGDITRQASSVCYSVISNPDKTAEYCTVTAQEDGQKGEREEKKVF